MESFPIEFIESEYDKQLGVYQKWIKGNKLQKIQKMYCMVAFQPYYENVGFAVANYQKYAEYLYLTISNITTTLQDWYVRIYIDQSIIHKDNPDKNIWIDKFNSIMGMPNVQIIAVKFPRYYLKNHCHKELLPVMFRYLALFDKTTSIMLFRDIDNIYTEQHHMLVDDWICSNNDVCFFMNESYKRQEIAGLTQKNVILSDTYYTTILSGLWNFRKDFDTILPVSLWQKIYYYIESYTNITYKIEYKNYINYKNRFSYGFDELALTRIIVPYFINTNLNIHSIPIRIYDPEYFANMFDNNLVKKFLRNISDDATIQFVKTFIINKYWDLYSQTAGLAQYMLCIITNIYFGIIQRKSKYYRSDTFISDIKKKILPNILLMSIANFTFKNFKRYNWFPIPGKDTSGSATVAKFLESNKKISIVEWTAGTYISVDLPPINPYPDEPDVPIYNI